jgi:hypothetical protein
VFTVGQKLEADGLFSEWTRRSWLALKLRTNREQPKYLAISGGHPCLFGADTLVPGEPAILTEGEFDAMLLWQEVGDLLGVATLGSCNRGVSARAPRYLLGCLWLLVAYDIDAEGEKGAERLGQLSPRMHRIRPPMGKDVTAFWQAGGRVQDWLQFERARLAATTRVGEWLVNHPWPIGSAGPARPEPVDSPEERWAASRSLQAIDPLGSERHKMRGRHPGSGGFQAAASRSSA